MTFNDLWAQRRLRLAIALIGMLAVAAGGYFTLTSAPDENELQFPVIEEPLSGELVLLGKIEPYRVVSLYAPFEGTVQSLAVKNGDRVNADDSLLTLNTRNLDVQLREALADKLRAQKSVQELRHWEKSPGMLTAQRSIAQLERALGHIRRQEAESRKLFTQGIIPRQELDELTLQRSTLETELAEAKEDRHQLSAQAQGEERQIAEMALLNAAEKYDDLLALRAKKNITAPFNGTVFFTDTRAKKPQATDTPATIEVGVHVAANQPLMQLATSDRFKIASFVAEHDLHQLRPGQSVTITGDGLNRQALRGVVEHISQHAEPADDITEPANFAVTIALDDIPAEARSYIRTGMLVTIAVSSEVS